MKTPSKYKKPPNPQTPTHQLMQKWLQKVMQDT